jgi:hypothetical protein
MLVFSPLLRQYYLVWALPALVLCVRAAVGIARVARTAGRIGVAVWLAGMVAWLWPEPRSYGAHLVMLIVLATLVLRIGAGSVSRSAVSTGESHA